MLSGVFEVGTPFKFEQKIEICRHTATTQLWQQQEIYKGNFWTKKKNNIYARLKQIFTGLLPFHWPGLASFSFF